MTLPARLQHLPAADRRASPRRRLHLGSNLQTSGDDVTIHDFSATGMLMETMAELAPFDGLEIDLPYAGITQAVVVWNSGRYYGCEFKEAVSQATVSAALLRSTPAVSAALAPPKATAPGIAETQSREDPEAYEKASLSVRLRVILGSAIILWALIIWAIRSLVRHI